MSNISERRKAIIKIFKLFNGYDPTDKDDLYILELLDKLKEIYDDNFEAINRCSSSGYQKDLSVYKKKEEILYRIGIYLQKWLNIYLKDSEIGGKDEPEEIRHPVSSRGNGKTGC
jgi:hypothetical protein